MERRSLAAVALGASVLLGWEVWQFQRMSRLEDRLDRQSTGRVAVASNNRVNTQIDLTGAAVEGHKEATVAFVVYSDFQCPYCTRFSRDTLAEIRRRYVATRQILVAFKHLPLDRIHSEARKLAEAAACAGMQNKFWAMHDLLFQRPPEIDSAVLATLADDLRLDKRAFVDCVDKGHAKSQVQTDANEAAALGIQSTPTSIIGKIRNGRVLEGELVRGARPLRDFTAILDRVLEEAR